MLPDGPVQPQQYRPKAPNRWPLIIGIFIAVLVLCVVVSLVSAAIYSANHPSPTVYTKPPTATPTAHSLVWKTLLVVTGNGAKKTAIFSVPGDWKIAYTCSGQNIGGTNVNGALAVIVYGSDGSIVDPAAVNATCKIPQTSDVTEEHQPGNIYLAVDGTGDWKLIVTGYE